MESQPMYRKVGKIIEEKSCNRMMLDHHNIFFMLTMTISEQIVFYVVCYQTNLIRKTIYIYLKCVVAEKAKTIKNQLTEWKETKFTNHAQMNNVFATDKNQRRKNPITSINISFLMANYQAL